LLSLVEFTANNQGWETIDSSLFSGNKAFHARSQSNLLLAVDNDVTDQHTLTISKTLIKINNYLYTKINGGNLQYKDNANTDRILSLNYQIRDLVCLDSWNCKTHHPSKTSITNDIV
jgi:hypothetical protein